METGLISSAEKDRLLKMLRGSKLDLNAFPRLRRRIPYGTHERQRMTVFLPEKGDGPFPAVMFLHGGGWEAGHFEDSQIKPLLPALAEGVAVIGCGYRLLPEAGFPDDLLDVKAALAFLNEKGADYDIDPGRLMIAGASAGAMLALTAAFSEEMAPYCGDYYGKLPHLRGCIDFYGPTDFSTEDEHFRQSGTPRMFPPAAPGNSPAERLLKADASANPSVLRLISPVRFVHPGIPPVLIFHGRHDPMVSSLQSQELHDAICRICGEGRSRLVLSEETTHADSAYEEEPYTSVILDFIRSCIK